MAKKPYPTTRAGRQERSIARKLRMLEKESMTHKECSLCKIVLPLSKFRVRKNYYSSGKDCIVSRCRKCEQEMNKIQRNPEIARLAERKRNANPERRERKNKFQREWRRKNIEKNRKYHRKNIKKNVIQLSDNYVQRSIFRAKKDGVAPPELIRLKRLQLLAKRIIKTQNNEPRTTSQTDVSRP